MTSSDLFFGERHQDNPTMKKKNIEQFLSELRENDFASSGDPTVAGPPGLHRPSEFDDYYNPYDDGGLYQDPDPDDPNDQETDPPDINPEWYDLVDGDYSNPSDWPPPPPPMQEWPPPGSPLPNPPYPDGYQMPSPNLDTDGDGIPDSYGLAPPWDQVPAGWQWVWDPTQPWMPLFQQDDDGNWVPQLEPIPGGPMDGYERPEAQPWWSPYRDPIRSNNPFELDTIPLGYDPLMPGLELEGMIWDKIIEYAIATGRSIWDILQNFDPNDPSTWPWMPGYGSPAGGPGVFDPAYGVPVPRPGGGYGSQPMV
jgi:hypothetical protein